MSEDEDDADEERDRCCSILLAGGGYKRPLDQWSEEREERKKAKRTRQIDIESAELERLVRRSQLATELVHLKSPKNDGETL